MFESNFEAKMTTKKKETCITFKQVECKFLDNVNDPKGELIIVFDKQVQKSGMFHEPTSYATLLTWKLGRWRVVVTIPLGRKDEEMELATELRRKSYIRSFTEKRDTK